MSDKTVVQFVNEQGNPSSVPAEGDGVSSLDFDQRLSPAESLEFKPVGESVDNPLLLVAAPLLERMAQLAGSAEIFDVSTLRIWCVKQIQRVDHYCIDQRLGDDIRQYTSYVLCTVMDELVNKTRWGTNVWSKQSLLSQFHGETGGGQRFFQLMEYLQLAPRKNIWLLELMYLCLGLGFEGRYRLTAEGYGQLEQLRDSLYHNICQLKGEPEADLSPHWRSQSEKKLALSSHFPLWMLGLVVTVFMTTTLLSFSWLLDQRTEPLVEIIMNHAMSSSVL